MQEVGFMPTQRTLKPSWPRVMLHMTCSGSSTANLQGMLVEQLYKATAIPIDGC